MYFISPMFLVGWLKHIKYNKIMILLGMNYSKSFHPVLCSTFRKISGWEYQEALRHISFNVPSLSTVSSAISQELCSCEISHYRKSNNNNNKKTAT